MRGRSVRGRVDPAAALSCYPVFHLSKWYLDCVTDEGEVFLAYHAELRWRSLKLDYASVLGGPSTLLRCPAPATSAGRIEWSAPALKVEGVWRATAAPETREVLAGITWSCQAPRASVEVTSSGRKLRGLGYVELLSVSVPPWRLGPAELRWGRFLSPADWLVWIHWRGRETRTITIHNGAEVDAAVAEALELDQSAVLRDGALADTALSIIPGVERLLPLRMLRARESKWRSRGVLRKPDGSSSEGWAIHEVVRWT